MIRWLLSAAALGTITGLALTVFGPNAALGVAVCALAVIIVGYPISAVRTDRRRARDKAYHPSMWGPLVPLRPGTIIFDTTPRPDRSGLECGRCGGSTFFSHKCIDGELVRGALDGLVG